MMLLFMALILYLFSSSLYEYPKKIDCYEGYRTKKSMENQENWEKAQKLMVTAYRNTRRALLWIGLMILLIELIFYFIFKIDLFLPLVILESVMIIGTCFYVHWYVERRI